MIHSMTAFSRFEVKGDWGNAVWEIRSVNQRFLETYFRLPEQFRSIEPVLRERFRKQLNRGKVECSLRFNANASEKNNLSLNKGLAEQLLQHAGWINEQTLNSQLNPLEIMRWPGVMEAEEADMTTIQKEILVPDQNVHRDHERQRGRVVLPTAGRHGRHVHHHPREQAHHGSGHDRDWVLLLHHEVGSQRVLGALMWVVCGCLGVWRFVNLMNPRPIMDKHKSTY